MGLGSTQPTLWEGTPLTSGYGQSQSSAFKVITTLKGRPRYKLSDPNASTFMSVEMDLSASDFNLWQTYWATVTNYGAYSFPMRLLVDNLPDYNSNPDGQIVHATGPWSAQIRPHNRWSVTLPIEISVFPDSVDEQCNDIYGGPIANLSDNDIYGGPLDDLSDNDITPCEEVLFA